MEKFLLVDGSNVLHRAFYALPLLTNRQGEYTNAVYGFMVMLEKLLQEVNPTYVAICFDKSRITFRSAVYEQYKAQRQATPAELSPQFELIKEVLAVYGIKALELDQYEADDIIGTLAKLGEKQNCQNIIGSGDKDLLQLISPQTTVQLMKKGISEKENFDLAKMMERYGLTPQTFVDFKALMGDSSDNIPGVAGIGEKTALKLLHAYHDLDDIYDHIEEVGPPKLQEKLKNGREMAYLSKQLATICCEAPVDLDVSVYKRTAPDYEKLRSIYERLNFRNLLANLPKEQKDETVNMMPVIEEDFYLPQDEAAFKEVVASYADCSEIGLYLSYEGQAIHGNIKAIGLSAPQKRSFGILLMGQQIDRNKINLLKELLENKSIRKVVAEAKEVELCLAAFNIKVVNIIDDVSLAAYLLQPERGHYDLLHLAQSYLHKEIACMDEAQQAAIMAQQLFPLREELKKSLEETKMLSIYYDMELPLSHVLAQMERTGIRVEKLQLNEMAQKLEEAAKQEEKIIFSLADMEFNINSPKQLGFVLFEKLGLPAAKKTKTGYSTSVDVLEQLEPAHEIIRHILDYRTYMKLRSTYAIGLTKAIAADGKLHTSFLQMGTATGRLASAEPNLQNIPVRLELGRQIRRVFIPEKEGDLLFAADYSQIELRILAHISGDPLLQDSFLKNQDVHARTASEVFDIPLEEVNSAQRRKAKAVNFGIVYGISDFGLSQNLGISRKEAKNYMDLYFAHYPKVMDYQKEAIRLGKEQGYVKTILGRRRYLPDLHNRNYNLRSFAERVAMNTPIQGTAADIIKLAMVKISAILKEKKLKSKMILQVHDELIFNMVPEEKDILPHIVKEAMEHAMTLHVPLVVDLKVGQDWYHMEKIVNEVL